MDKPIYTNHIPTQIIEKLTATQQKELDHVGEDYVNTPNAIHIMYKHLNTSNPALWYLLLRTTWKYNLAENIHITDNDIKELFNYDNTHKDGIHEIIYPQMNDQEVLFEQSFSTACSFLKSPNITQNTVLYMLETLKNNALTQHYDTTTFCETLSYQLLDKWEPKRFTPTTKQALVTFFEKNNAKEETRRFKKFLPRTKQK